MKTLSVRFLLTLGLLLATWSATVLASLHPPAALRAPLKSIATNIDGWNSLSEEPLTPRMLSRLQPTDYLARAYRKEHRELELFIAFYARQRAGESMHSPKHCLPGSGWSMIQTGTVSVPAGDTKAEINNYLIRKGDDRSVVLYWYQTRRRIIANEYSGKAFLIRDALLDGETSGSIVRIVLPDGPEAVNEGVRFAAQLIPQMKYCLTGSVDLRP